MIRTLKQQLLRENQMNVNVYLQSVTVQITPKALHNTCQLRIYLRSFRSCPRPSPSPKLAPAYK
ncbi:Bgt-4124 [Blumeria graminis f. sp. tritici]|uniref:Bgt-4124 n=2 Tax=Blumeria graminis f. sp. tritici TaxID=62690 RepID=A0A381L8Y7_BLUGR|nr:hypothetical protein BGT96224_4124 [Blumeria graminis f. sp. tritici 96224]VCU40495.1 Bgt-4124 [Blumeria graminis f. sp. tritici]